MNIPCETIKDLLPLYIDGVCSEESRALVEAHLAECEKCGRFLEAMRTIEASEKKEAREMKMENGLKNLKSRFNSRLFIGIISAVLAALIVVTTIGTLCTQPLKELGPENIRISAEAFNAGELPVLDAEKEGASISLRVSGEYGSKLVAAQIPSMPNTIITMTESALEEMDACTVVWWESDYYIRRMQWRYSDVDPGVVYLSSVRTSIFNNKADEESRNTISIENGAIHKIIYIGKDGEETVLWEQAEDTNAELTQQINP